MGESEERGLLVGLVAVQLGFVSQQDFVAGLSAWADDKSVSLPEWLEKRGGITPDALKLVRPLVDKHVAAHDGDTSKSLAAVQLNGAVSQMLEQVDDPVVARTRSLVSDSQNKGGDRLPRPAAGSGGRSTPGGRSTIRGDGSDGKSRPADEGRFSIVHPHARGGLGEVFVARDHELNRQVAVKEIRGGRAGDETSRGRFLLEAEITGGLEHPGIVPVYGLGTYADGRPFYAMRFVRGDNLGEAIRQFFKGHPQPRRRDYGGREFRGLLGRFVDVCQAIEYAHSRGVLHRDLKPGNIMLGRHGETLVVDWGLAKAAGRSDDETRDEPTLHPASGERSFETTHGQAIGTPLYMSPEAATGDLEAMGPRSDVYSLGATLYHVLTGQAAYEPGVGVVETVKEGVFPPPRERIETVPRPLEEICLKAMSSRPDDRYASCAELAADVERYLADEPVSAAPDPLSTRIGRTVRRNQRAFATAAALGTVSLVGISALSLRLADRNGELNVANALVVESRDEAVRQRDVARESAVISRRLAATLADVVDTQLGQVPGQQALRETLTDETAAALRALSRVAEVPDDLAGVRSRTARLSAFIKRSARRYLEAESLLDDAVGEARRVLERDEPGENGPGGTSEPPRLLLAEALLDRAIIRKFRDRDAAAAEDLDEASEILSPLVARQPDDPDLRRLSGSIAMERSGLAEVQLDWETMFQASRTAAESLARLADRPDADDRARAFALMAGSAESRSLWHLGRRDESAAAYEAVARRGRTWTAQFGGRNTRHLTGRAIFYHAYQLLEIEPRPSTFPAAAEEALALYEALADEFGGDFPLYRRYEQRCRLLTAITTADAGDPAAADEAAEAVGDYFREALLGDEHSSELLNDLAWVALWRAEFAAQRNDPPQVNAHLRRAVELQGQAVEQSPDVAIYRRRRDDYQDRLLASKR